MARAKNGSTTNLSNDLIENISKIELVDGSMVIFSLSGAEAQGLAFYGHGVKARDFLRGTPSQNQYCDIWLMFGRYMYDKMLALDPTKFSNLQLKVTWNLATVNAVSATTGFVTGTLVVRIVARLMEEVPTPEGFLMTKQHYSYGTGGSSTTKYLDLPTDHPYRFVAMRVHVENKQGMEILQNIKLNIDAESYVPFELTGSDLANIGLALRGFAEEGRYIYAKHSTTIDLSLFNPGRHGQSLQGENAGEIWCASGGGNRFTVNLFDHSGAAITSYKNARYIGRGVAKMDCLVYPFGRIDEPEDWLDVSQFGSVRLEPQTEGWSATATVMLQQLKKY